MQSYLSSDCSTETDYFLKIFWIASHKRVLVFELVCTRNEIEIVQRTVFFVAIFELNVVAFWDWPVEVFPDKAVLEYPLVRLLDLHLNVTVHVHSFTSYRAFIQ